MMNMALAQQASDRTALSTKPASDVSESISAADSRHIIHTLITELCMSQWLREQHGKHPTAPTGIPRIRRPPPSNRHTAQVILS